MTAASYLEHVAERWEWVRREARSRGASEEQLARVEAMASEFGEGTGHRLDARCVEWRVQVTPAGVLHVAWTRWPRRGPAAGRLDPGHYNRHHGSIAVVTAFVRDARVSVGLEATGRGHASLYDAPERGLPAEAAEALSVPALLHRGRDTWGLRDADGTEEAIFARLPDAEVAWREGPIVFARGQAFRAVERWRHPVTGDTVEELRELGRARTLALRALRWAGAEAGTLAFVGDDQGEPSGLHVVRRM